MCQKCFAWMMSPRRVSISDRAVYIPQRVRCCACCHPALSAWMDNGGACRHCKSCFSCLSLRCPRALTVSYCSQSTLPTLLIAEVGTDVAAAARATKARKGRLPVSICEDHISSWPANRDPAAKAALAEVMTFHRLLPCLTGT